MSIYNKVGASTTRAVGEFPSSNNLRLQNLVESQLEITKTKSCLIALRAKFAVSRIPLCLSPRTPYILAPSHGLREIALKSRREYMDSCRIDVLGKFGRYRPSRVRARSLRSDRAWLELGCFVATEPCACSIATLRPSLALARSLRTDLAWLVRGKICVRCPRTIEWNAIRLGLGLMTAAYVPLFEGIKPFVVRLGVKVLMTCFPARPLRSSLYVEVIMHVAADGMCELAGFLKMLEYWPRDKFWDLVSGCLILCLEMLETTERNALMLEDFS
ncbi:hypothetical protein F2Q68_00039756 [Brassica cretica]|uniref:Uncharacterized protein n=1 Tax=Brassica cretica TaxID=69181 RepID=A0A8S9MKU0_BRACR|nr:hypothetical protein F2Q68_00039756 [Brassica cretica]